MNDTMSRRRVTSMHRLPQSKTNVAHLCITLAQQHWQGYSKPWSNLGNNPSDKTKVKLVIVTRLPTLETELKGKMLQCRQQASTFKDKRKSSSNSVTLSQSQLQGDRQIYPTKQVSNPQSATISVARNGSGNVAQRT